MWKDRLRHYAGFWNRPFRTPAQIRAYQNDRLVRLVRAAARDVPFYRERFRQAGFDADSFRGLEDLSRIPLTTRAEIQQAPPQSLLSRRFDLERCVVRRTSGSTNQPVRVVRSRGEETLLAAHRLRMLIHLGLRTRDRRLGVGVNDVAPRWPHRLGLWPMDALDHNLPVSEIVPAIRRHRPQVVRVRSDLLFEVLQRTPAEELRDLGVRLVFCGAALSTKEVRERAREAFGCPVIDLYGAHEINLVAFECPDCRCYHPIDDSVVYETLKDGKPVGPGEDGVAYVTALHSYAAPFIRYRLGDVASRPDRASDCRFGFSRLEGVLGRSQQMLEFPGGAVVHPNGFFRELTALPGIGCFQIVREGPMRIRIHMEPIPGHFLPSFEAIEQRCRTFLPAGVRIDFQEGRIERSPGVKQQLVRVAPPDIDGGMRPAPAPPARETRDEGQSSVG